MTSNDKLIAKLIEASKCHFFGTWEGDAAKEAADALTAAQKRIDELEAILRETLEGLEIHYQANNPHWDGSAVKGSVVGKARTALQANTGKGE